MDHRKLKKDELTRAAITAELKESLAKTKTLSGLLPICSMCKKIRDDKGYWNQIDAYIEEHSDAEFSHSICQECAKNIIQILIFMTMTKIKHHYPMVEISKSLEFLDTDTMHNVTGRQ
jgi:hypothetical protein